MNPSFHRTVSIWINSLSIDAVAVGMLWQAIFARGFRGTWPSLVEATTLAMTLWLIYTADRLLDAARLDLNRSHTFRHLFHYRHHRTLVAVWIVVTLADTGIIIYALPESLIRWGLALAALVLAYGANVHFRSVRQSVIGKELQVGTIFAIGVGLLAWAHQPTIGLAIATLLAAVLFSANCISVGLAESESDHEQGFPSFANRHFKSGDKLSRILALLFFVALAITFVGVLPKIVSLSIALCSLTLAWSTRTILPRSFTSSPPTRPTVFSPTQSLLADAMLLVPIGLWWWV